jgi:hypothetical protein
MSDRVVGPERFELSTSRLSAVRSNQLSYGPTEQGETLAYHSLVALGASRT